MRRTVLLVEDHPDIRGLYALALSLHGFDVVEATDGTFAVTWLADHVPDAVVTDLAMPGIDGIELCRRIRATPNGGNVPILAVTGQSSARAREDVAAAGACALLEKPVTPDDLGHAVKALLAEGKLCSRCWETGRAFRWVRIGQVHGLMRHEPFEPD